METDQRTGNGRKRGKRERTAAGSAEPRTPVAFVDSSAIVALIDRDDRTHTAAVEAYRSLVASGYRLFTTNHVVVEVYDLLASGLGHDVARQWLRGNRLAVYTTDEDDEEKARKMVANADGNQSLSLTDALSIVVMERLGVNDAFAVDPNFLAALT
jgi:predicted nucleic acid-binding protein